MLFQVTLEIDVRPNEGCPELREKVKSLASAEIADTEISEPDFVDCSAVYYVAGKSHGDHGGGTDFDNDDDSPNDVDYDEMMILSL